MKITLDGIALNEKQTIIIEPGATLVINGNILGCNIQVMPGGTIEANGTTMRDTVIEKLPGTRFDEAYQPKENK
jgi:cytoskeletal protein CcmA (bactofilin family)